MNRSPNFPWSVQGIAPMVFCCFAGLMVVQPLVAAAGEPAHELARRPLARTSVETFAGESAEFFVRLPGHIYFRDGSQLVLVLHPSRPMGDDAPDLIVSINGQPLSPTPLAEGNEISVDGAVRIRANLPPELLIHEWNRVTLQLLFDHTRPGARAATREVTWTLRQAESYLEIAFQRLPPYPELLRFPHTYTEDKLLRPFSETTVEEEQKPLVTLWLPAERRDIHLRACAVLGARLGQAGYVSGSDVRLAELQDWSEGLPETHCIAVARVDELDPLSVPPNVQERAGALLSGQGLLAEWIVRTPRRQFRHLLVSGHDDEGLEKALLTLGSDPALATLPPSPAVIDQAPQLPAALETKATPTPCGATFKSLGWPLVQLRGYAVEQTLSGWRLPPGFEIARNSSLRLQFSHSGGISNSVLQVLINGGLVGEVALKPNNSVTTERILLPRGLSGRDPMLLTFRTRIDPGVADGNGRPWVVVHDDSTLAVTTVPSRIDDLARVDRLLLGDRYLREGAFVLPAGAAVGELKFLFELALHTGGALPSSPVLWPEACGYSADAPPPAARLKDRSVFLLGSVDQLSRALPPGTWLPVIMPDAQSELVLMHGRRYRVDAFEPTLQFLQLIESPWSPNETLVTAGGWRSFAKPALSRMLWDPQFVGKVHGNVSAMDARGRTTAYDTRQSAIESLAARIQREIPAGLTVEETAVKLREHEAALQRSSRLNLYLIVVTPVVLVLLVAARVWFLWDRTRSRRRTLESETPFNPAS